MFRRSFIICTLLAGFALPGAASAKIKVAASINDLASIASSVGGDRVEVFSIAKPNADVHHIETLPSYMVKVARAQVYVKVGLGLDQWADGIIDGSRNEHLVVVDAAENVTVLEKPTAQVTALMGDVHPYGNPHYWLDPRVGAVIARNIAEGLAKIDPGHGDEYRANAEIFAKQAEDAYAREKTIADKLPAKSMITYHRSWSYLANAFGIVVAGEAEPVPGIPPTGKHLAELVGIIKAQKVPLFLQEPYFSNDAGQFLAREGGLHVVVMSPSCDSTDAGSYLAHFDQILNALAQTGS